MSGEYVRELRIRDSELFDSGLSAMPFHVAINLFCARRLQEAGFKLSKISPLGLDQPELAAPWEMYRDESRMELVIKQGGCA